MNASSSCSGSEPSTIVVVESPDSDREICDSDTSRSPSRKSSSVIRIALTRGWSCRTISSSCPAAPAKAWLLSLSSTAVSGASGRVGPDGPGAPACGVACGARWSRWLRLSSPANDAGSRGSESAPTADAVVSGTRMAWSVRKARGGCLGCQRGLTLKLTSSCAPASSSMLSNV
eukprot:2454300-Rhodomonas_salina.3